MWTFEFRYTADKGGWTQSSQTWDTWQEAWKKAGDWCYACFENDFPCEIRLLKVL